jgi:hypothetical protein
MFDQTRGLYAFDLLNPLGLAEKDVFASIAHLEASYPGFEAWLHAKVFPGIRNGTRRVRAVVTDGDVRAVSIAKRDNQEKKLCTLWVAPSARTSGIGSSLAKEAFGWLGTDNPLFTVPDDRLPEFRPLLSRWGFNLIQVVDGAYRPGSQEFVFNGVLRHVS